MGSLAGPNPRSSAMLPLDAPIFRLLRNAGHRRDPGRNRRPRSRQGHRSGRSMVGLDDHLLHPLDTFRSPQRHQDKRQRESRQIPSTTRRTEVGSAGPCSASRCSPRRAAGRPQRTATSTTVGHRKNPRGRSVERRNETLGGREEESGVRRRHLTDDVRSRQPTSHASPLSDFASCTTRAPIGAPELLLDGLEAYRSGSSESMNR